MFENPMFHTAISGEQAEDNLRCRPAQFRIGHFVTPAGKARDLGRRDVGENPALRKKFLDQFLRLPACIFPLLKESRIRAPNNLVLRVPCRPPIIPVCGRTYHTV